MSADRDPRRPPTLEELIERVQRNIERSREVGRRYKAMMQEVWERYRRRNEADPD